MVCLTMKPSQCVAANQSIHACWWELPTAVVQARQLPWHWGWIDTRSVKQLFLPFGHHYVQRGRAWEEAAGPPVSVSITSYNNISSYANRYRWIWFGLHPCMIFLGSVVQVADAGFLVKEGFITLLLRVQRIWSCAHFKYCWIFDWNPCMLAVSCLLFQSRIC